MITHDYLNGNFDNTGNENDSTEHLFTMGTNLYITLVHKLADDDIDKFKYSPSEIQ